MKKTLKTIIVNTQEDEDTGLYVLHPENAVTDSNQKKPQQLNVAAKHKLKTKPPFRPAENINRIK